MEDIIQVYIKALQKGSQEAFNAIYDMYADKLYGFVLAHTKSQQISKDIVQDTFLKLWINHKSISTEGSLQSLLFTISKNKMIDVFRSQINTVEFDMFVELNEKNQLYDNEIEKKLDYDDFLNILKLCKKFLSERELEIFELNKEKGFSIEEIANQLSISEQTVKNQLTNSIKKIRTQFQKINKHIE
ncbi:sigma-70 family RNA polymerase sigma factor [Porphyromonadaceae sp. NP-X]|jgi:RNA polymerase sigma-70 factor (ECF subfamily)|nr:sigma-70 family RNA polymerase sigma factor [Porphyromonadaceae sp. NP-X]